MCGRGASARGQHAEHEADARGNADRAPRVMAHVALGVDGRRAIAALRVLLRIAERRLQRFDVRAQLVAQPSTPSPGTLAASRSISSESFSNTRRSSTIFWPPSASCCVVSVIIRSLSEFGVHVSVQCARERIALSRRRDGNRSLHVLQFGAVKKHTRVGSDVANGVPGKFRHHMTDETRYRHFRPNACQCISPTVTSIAGNAHQSG